MLRPNGIFVTKIFRSNDYNTLIWILNKFFDQVEVTKPEASRNTSAEIFVVCLGFKAPEFVDKKLFDIQHVFQDTEADLIMPMFDRAIKSAKAVLQKRRHRTGYADSMPHGMHKKISI